MVRKYVVIVCPVGIEFIFLGSIPDGADPMVEWFVVFFVTHRL